MAKGVNHSNVEQIARAAAAKQVKEIEDNNSVLAMNIFYKVFAIAVHRVYGFKTKRTMRLFEEVDRLMGDKKLLEDLDRISLEESGINITFN